MDVYNVNQFCYYYKSFQARRGHRSARLRVVQRVRNEGATPVSVRQDGVAGLTRTKESCGQHVADNVLLKQKITGCDRLFQHAVLCSSLLVLYELLWLSTVCVHHFFKYRI